MSLILSAVDYRRIGRDQVAHYAHVHLQQHLAHCLGFLRLALEPMPSEPDRQQVGEHCALEVCRVAGEHGTDAIDNRFYVGGACWHTLMLAVRIKAVDAGTVPLCGNEWRLTVATFEVYLGDGLYASYDGWYVRLRAPGVEGDGSVFLEPEVLRALMRFTSEMGIATHVPPA